MQITIEVPEPLYKVGDYVKLNPDGRLFVIQSRYYVLPGVYEHGEVSREAEPGSVGWFYSGHHVHGDTDTWQVDERVIEKRVYKAIRNARFLTTKTP